MDLARGAAYHGLAMSPLELSHLLPVRIGRCSFAAIGLLLSSLACGAPQQPPAQAPTEPELAPSEPASSPPPAPVSSTSTSTSTPGEPQEAAPKDTRGKEQIQAVIAANREKVRACYEAALQKNPGIQGDLVIAFVINPDGSVKSAEVNWAESELHVPELDSCALDVLRTIKFPASSRGLESKVNYPFNFNPRKP